MLLQRTQLRVPAIRTAVKHNDWFKSDTSCSSLPQHKSFTLLMLNQRSIRNIYSQSPFTFCSTFFSDRLLQYGIYLMSAKLKAKPVSKVLRLAVAQNHCNLKWTRKLHHVINRIISVYLLCQRKTNRVSKKGSVTTLLLEEKPGSGQARGNFSQYYFLWACNSGQPPPLHTWKKTQRTNTSGNSHPQHTHKISNYQPIRNSSNGNTWQDTKDSRAESCIFIYNEMLNGDQYPLHFNVCLQSGQLQFARAPTDHLSPIPRNFWCFWKNKTQCTQNATPLWPVKQQNYASFSSLQWVLLPFHKRNLNFQSASVQRSSHLPELPRPCGVKARFLPPPDPPVPFLASI